MIDTTHADGRTEARGHLIVRRLYRRYLAQLGIAFPELLIISALHDGKAHEVTRVASNLNLDAPLISSSIANLERLNFIDRLYPSPVRASSIALVADARRVAESLLVIQANVDLDFGMISEEINRLRRSLLLLAQRAGKRPAAR